MAKSLRVSNCRFRNENPLKGRGSEDVGTANLRAQRSSVVAPSLQKDVSMQFCKSCCMVMSYHFRHLPMTPKIKLLHLSGRTLLKALF